MCLSNRKWFFPITGTFLFIIILLSFTSCKNDIEKINTFAPAKDLPTVSGVNTEIIYTDSARLKLRIIAPELHKYDQVEEPYVEFPRGIEVYFYNENKKITSEIQAGYAIYYETKNLWEARDNVIAKNLEEGKQLNTEQLFWDQDKGRIYSDQFVKITNPDGVFYGENGFEAKQDLSKWRLKGSKGTVNLKDEE
ncbi:MAG TPA: LPS export ABC transporter periplasmic protein LptC [Bacteroidales bacterium]|nr:LPS export ABC transporter periplasmic protein LptC [Bacteroidales bacterium]